MSSYETTDHDTHGRKRTVYRVASTSKTVAIHTCHSRTIEISMFSSAVILFLFGPCRMM